MDLGLCDRSVHDSFRMCCGVVGLFPKRMKFWGPLLRREEERTWDRWSGASNGCNDVHPLEGLGVVMGHVPACTGSVRNLVRVSGGPTCLI